MPAPATIAPPDATRRRRPAPGSPRPWLLGLASTGLVLAAHRAGLLDGLERRTQDYRAVAVAGPRAALSDRIAVVAVDDQAIRTIGRPPFGRDRVAEMVREMTLAGAAVIAMDVLLDEPQDPARDAALAEAFREHGSVVQAARFPLAAPDEGTPDPANPVFRIPIEAAIDALRAAPAAQAGDADEAARALAPVLLPEWARGLAGGPEHDELRRVVGQAWSMLRHAPTSSLPIATPGRGAAWARTASPRPPIPVIAGAAAAIGGVSVRLDPDGRLRHVPLLTEFDGHLWPNLALAAVARSVGAPLGSAPLRLRTRGLLAAGGSLDLAGAEGPALTAYLVTAPVEGFGPMDGLHLVTWPRAARGWTRQLDSAAGASAIVSMGHLYEPVALLRRVRSNARNADASVGAAVEAGSLAVDDGFDARRRVLADDAAPEAAWREALAGQRETWADAVLHFRAVASEVSAAGAAASAEDRRRGRLAAEAADSLERAAGEIDRGLERVHEVRADLRARLDRRICFVGYTATGTMLSDTVPTAIDAKTPGVIVHAAVANALLTGYSRRPVPWWLDSAVVVGMGLAGAWVARRAPVAAGPVGVLALGAAWWGVAAHLLWGRYLAVVAVAGPLIAAGAAWVAVLMHRLVVEQHARRRTEQRFRSYVSPAVVDILVSHPELSTMAPQRRDLTVMFADLAGFTATAERLGSDRTAEVLGRYLGAMTRILQDRRATIDKYLGDGIMAFWGAPLDDPAPGHAVHACQAVADMLREIDRMNAAGAFGPAGPLDLRIGLASGELMVGDFGNPPRNSSYTVIGDAANLAARLERATRILGARALVSARVWSLAAGPLAATEPAIAWRPVGRITVAGRRTAEEVFELVVLSEGARAGEWIDWTSEAVAAYARGDLDGSLAAWDRLEHRFGPDRLAAAYRRAAAAWKSRGFGNRAGDGTEFDGTIDVTEK
jgi:class 3 adenylate cyclase/CHASE2 domain-containing sensor protein